MKAILGALFALSVIWGVSESAHAADRKVTAHFETHTPGSGQTLDHQAWDAFLKAYVTADADAINRVNYAGVSAEDRRSLEAYLGMLTNTDPGDLDRAEQFAYWVNLYNALTVKIVLDAYPVKSIRRITLGRLVAIGPWGQPIVIVDGQDLSLDNIEHDILRAIWRDPRIHYAVNCASLGCPNLQLEAFTPGNAEALLEAGARAYINHPRGVAVEGGKLKVSSIYKWFKEDFGGDDAGVLSHLSQYADEDTQSLLDGRTKVDRYDYDWALNDAATE